MFMEVGKVEKNTLVEETEIEWKITDFFSLFENEKIQSPIFCFANVSWHLEIWPQCSEKRAFIRLYICNDIVREYSVEYTFGLTKHDGSVEQLMKGNLEGNKGCNKASEASFIKESEVRQRKSVLVPSGILTIKGRLKFGTVSSIQPSLVLDKPKLENLIKLDTLSENFKSLYFNKDSCDTTVHVQDKEYKAHRAVLIARSSVFAAMFQHETTEKLTGIINIPDCDPESFEVFLKFLYTGKLEEPSCRSALDLYEISDKYDMQELKTFCVDFLMENLTIKNVCDIAVFADKYEETNLLSATQLYFNENVNDIFETSEWDSLVKNNYRLSKTLMRGMLTNVKVLH